LSKKILRNYDSEILLNTMNPTRKTKNALFYLRTIGSDFQNQNDNYIMNCKNSGGKWNPCDDNAEPLLVEYAIRHCIPATWLNDRDQFLAPKSTWENDRHFIADCVVWSMLNNAINIEKGENHLNPFMAKEVGCETPFGSKFGSELICSIELTDIGKETLEAGRDLCKHYYKQMEAIPGASISDIRRYFKQGKGKSKDEIFNGLDAELRAKCAILQENIRIGAYKHRFLLN